MNDLTTRIFSSRQREIAEAGTGWRNVTNAVFLKVSGPGEIVVFTNAGKRLKIWRQRSRPIVLQPLGHGTDVFSLKILYNPQSVLFFVYCIFVMYFKYI